MRPTYLSRALGIYEISIVNEPIFLNNEDVIEIINRNIEFKNYADNLFKPYKEEKELYTILTEKYSMYEDNNVTLNRTCILCGKIVKRIQPEVNLNPITKELMWRCKNKCHPLHNHFIYNIDTRSFDYIAKIIVKKRRVDIDYYFIWKTMIEKIYKLPKNKKKNLPNYINLSSLPPYFELKTMEEMTEIKRQESFIKIQHANEYIFALHPSGYTNTLFEVIKDKKGIHHQLEFLYK